MRVPLGVHRRSGRRYPFLVPSDAGGDQLVPVAQLVTGMLAGLRRSSGCRCPWLSAPHDTHISSGGGWVLPRPTNATAFTPGVAGRMPSWSLVAMSSLMRVGWAAVRSAGIMTMAWMHIRRYGCVRLARRVGRSGTATLGGGGNLFDFLCLWYDVSAREMWRHIRADEKF
jgi:hypothetical protein